MIKKMLTYEHINSLIEEYVTYRFSHRESSLHLDNIYRLKKWRSTSVRRQSIGNNRIY